MFGQLIVGRPLAEAFGLVVLTVLLAAPQTSAARGSNGLSVSHFEELQEFRYLSAEGRQEPSATAAVTFNALGRAFDLQLESNNRLLSAAARHALPSGIHLYRGRIAGNPESWVRIVMFNGAPSGLIWDGDELLAVEAPGDSAVAGLTPVIYRLADTYAADGVMGCGAADANVGAMYDALLVELSGAAAQAARAASQINIGAVGDFEFTSSMSDAAAAIVTRLNSVDGIFSTQVGVQLVLQENEVFATSNDPFTSTTDASALLSELSQYRRNSPNQIIQGLTHLFTGRDLAGSSVGLANIGLLCNNRFSVGLTQGTLGAALDSLVAAHEIGHNFGAPHDGEAGSACESVPQDFIMALSLHSGLSEFSSCSIEQMQPVIAAAPCITSLAAVDVAVSAVGPTSPILLGNNATLDVTVSNAGSDDATNVGLDVTLPNVVTYVSATVSPGSCSDGAGRVTCQLGTIPGGGTNTVTISTSSSSVGAGSFGVSASADVDENTGNNQTSVQVTVNPAVDLVVNGTGGGQLLLNESTTVSVSLENTATMDATGPSLTMTLDDGLRVDAASWPLGTCTTSAQRIDCLANVFRAQSSTTLTVDLTGTATGRHSYSVSMSSTEADRDEANNNGTGSVTVSETGGGSSGEGGGGGATGVALLSLLSIALLRRRRGTVRRAVIRT